MVVQYDPEYENSGYTRQVVWIDSEILRVLETELHDRKDALPKTLKMGTTVNTPTSSGAPT